MPVSADPLPRLAPRPRRLPRGVTGHADLPAPFGEHQPLPFGGVRFEAIGAAGLRAVAALGGISAGRHLARHSGDPRPGWWEAQVGPGAALDPRRFRVIGMDYLGDTLQAGDAVPLVDARDQARALARSLDALGVRRLEALVGASYGGMVALAFAALFPERVARLVVLSAAHEPHPMATAVRAVQRRIVREALRRGCGAEGLALARALAMTTYRTDRELAARFDGAWSLVDDAPRFPVEEYLDHCGRRYLETSSPERFLCLSQSIDLHRVDPAEVTVPVTLAMVEGDPIAPPWQMESLAGRLGGPVRLHRIDSVFGHDAFLKEAGAIGNLLTTALETDA